MYLLNLRAVRCRVQHRMLFPMRDAARDADCTAYVEGGARVRWGWLRRRRVRCSHRSAGLRMVAVTWSLGRVVVARPESTRPSRQLRIVRYFVVCGGAPCSTTFKFNSLRSAVTAHDLRR
jgi:hypothetical protein